MVLILQRLFIFDQQDLEIGSAKFAHDLPADTAWRKNIFHDSSFASGNGDPDEIPFPLADSFEKGYAFTADRRRI